MVVETKPRSAPAAEENKPDLVSVKQILADSKVKEGSLRREELWFLCELFRSRNAIGACGDRDKRIEMFQAQGSLILRVDEIEKGGRMPVLGPLIAQVVKATPLNLPPAGKIVQVHGEISAGEVFPGDYSDAMPVVGGTINPNPDI